MANRYFNWPANPLRFVSRDSARAEDVNAAFDDLSAAMDSLDDDVERSLKLPPGSGDQSIGLTALQRAGLVLGFDDLGQLTSFPSGGRSRGDWATATAYSVGDTFRDATNGSIYTVVLAHISTVLSADIMVGKVRLTIDVEAVEAARALAQASAAASAASAAAASASASSALTSQTNSSASATAAANSASAAAASAASIAGGPVTSVNGLTGAVTLNLGDKVVALAGGSNFNLSNGNNYFHDTIAASRTLTVSNATADSTFVFEFYLTAGAITWPAGSVWSYGAVPIFDTGKRHLVFFQRTHVGTAGWMLSALPGYSA